MEAPFALAGAVGVVASLSGTIAAAGISVFVLSSWETDYLLVQADRVSAATAALRAGGHRVLSNEQ